MVFDPLGYINKILNKDALKPSPLINEDVAIPYSQSDQKTDVFICGPNITTKLIEAVEYTKTKFEEWDINQRTKACNSLTSIATGWYAWDIDQLHNHTWIKEKYQPSSCATSGAEKESLCDYSVQVNNSCHYSGSVNYVIFGVMCKLCNSHFSSIKSRDSSDFTEEAMLKLIYNYKVLYPLAQGDPPAANYEAAKNWAVAGFNGWPTVDTPPGDRQNCLPKCTKPYEGEGFVIHWVPMGWFSKYKNIEDSSARINRF